MMQVNSKAYLSQAYLKEAPVSSPNINQPPETNLETLPFFGGLVILGFFIAFLKRSQKNSTQELKSTNFHKAPCTTCRFFNNNSYLKCAVHPTKVLNEQAEDCPDYWAQDSDKITSN